MDTGKFRLGDKVLVKKGNPYFSRLQNLIGEVVAVTSNDKYVIYFEEGTGLFLHSGDIIVDDVISYSGRHYVEPQENYTRLIEPNKGLYLRSDHLDLVKKKGNTRIFREV